MPTIKTINHPNTFTLSAVKPEAVTHLPDHRQTQVRGVATHRRPLRRIGIDEIHRQPIIPYRRQQLPFSLRVQNNMEAARIRQTSNKQT